MEDKMNSPNTSNNDKKIRNNIRSIIYKFLSNIINNIIALIPIVIFFVEKSFVLIPILIVLELSYIILKWFNEYILLKQDEVQYHFGILSKNVVLIPKKNLKSMDISRGIADKLLRYSTVKIENPSTDLNIKEIKMHLTVEDIHNIKEFALLENPLKEKNAKAIRNESFNDNKIKKINKFNTYQKIIDKKTLFKYGLTSFNIVIVFLGISKGYQVLENIISKNKIDTFMSNITLDSSQRFNIFYGIFGIVVLIIILKLLAIEYNIIKYYNFTISKENKNIKIIYGLINNKEFSFNEDSVKIIKLKSNLLRQLLNLYEMQVVVKGYSDSIDEKIILWPLGKEEEHIKILNEILPNWNMGLDCGKGITKGKIMLVAKPIMIVLAISIVVFMISKNIWTLLINLILIVIIPHLILEAKDTSLKLENYRVKIINGGIVKKINILNKKDIQAIEFCDTLFQRKYNLGKIKIYYYSEISDKVCIKYMNQSYINELIK